MAKAGKGKKLDKAVAREVVREKTAQGKKTGKRGIGPMEVTRENLGPAIEEDFLDPNVKAGTAAAQDLSEQPAGNVLTLTSPAGREDDDEEESEGDELPAAQIQDGMALMRFVRLKPMVNKKSGARALGLELSVALTRESAGLFGSAIEDRYAILNNHQLKDLHLNGMETHLFDLKEARDTENGFALHTPLVPERVSLSAVQQKGDGEERRVIRLSFVAPVGQSDHLCVWACKTHGELVWVKMVEQQRSLSRASR
jgi:hypothetical protein